MGLFNDIIKKTTQTTNKIAGQARLKLKINAQKSEISDLYEQIGKKVYEKHIREEYNEMLSKDLIGICKKIDKIAQEIEDEGKELLRLSKKRQCDRCKAQIEEEALFCPRCGEKQDADKTVFEEAKEKLEEVDIKPENQKGAEKIKQDLKGKIEKED